MHKPQYFNWQRCGLRNRWPEFDSRQGRLNYRFHRHIHTCNLINFTEFLWLSDWAYIWLCASRSGVLAVPVVLRGGGVGWAPKPVHMLWRREKFYCPSWLSNEDYPSSGWAIPASIARLQLHIVMSCKTVGGSWDICSVFFRRKTQFFVLLLHFKA